MTTTDRPDDRADEPASCKHKFCAECGQNIEHWMPERQVHWGIWKGGAQVRMMRDEQAARDHAASPIHGGIVVHTDYKQGRWVNDDSDPVTGDGWKGGESDD